MAISGASLLQLLAHNRTYNYAGGSDWFLGEFQIRGIWGNLYQVTELMFENLHKMETINLLSISWYF